MNIALFLEMTADIVLNSNFPDEELARERRVIEQEFTEFEDDPVSMAFQLFDRACFGATHPAGQPVIGKRVNLRRFTRDDLLDYVKAQYTASNLVVAAAGPVDVALFLRAVEAAFGAMPMGTPNLVSAPAASSSPGSMRFCSPNRPAGAPNSPGAPTCPTPSTKRVPSRNWCSSISPA